MSDNDEMRASVLMRIIESGNGWIHMTGVLGVSMSSLALMLLSRGVDVSGSDDDNEASRDALSSAGVYMRLDRRVAICSANALVYSSAIAEDHPDRRLARRLGIPQCSRAELLGALMLGYENRVGVSGTHGKSTTTAMLASIFEKASLYPTVLCGARMKDGKSYIRGREDYLIYEACEYRDSFLHFSPTCAIITNIELDHTDYFKSEETLEASFLKSAEGAKRAVVSADYPISARVARELGNKAITVGRSIGADHRYEPIYADAHCSRFKVYLGDSGAVELSVGVPGQHNVDNAAAAAVTAMLHGVREDQIASGLADFRGVDKRTERLGVIRGRTVYRDYAHHPTEIRCAISTVKEIHGSVAVLFRPHTYTRTRDLWCGFVRELSQANEVGICDIYPARESPISGISAERLAEAIEGACAFSVSNAMSFILEAESSAIVLIGAGDLGALEREILRYTKEM